MVTLEPSEFSKITNIIVEGSVVAIPTDTVYGLVCKFDCKKAIEKIYQIKKRSLTKPLQILVSDWEQAKKFGVLDDDLVRYLESNFAKGQVTVIVRKQELLDQIPYWQKLDSVAIRATNSSFVQKIIDSVGPLAATSCNISGEEEINDAKKINLANLDYVVRGEIVDAKASTIYDSINQKIIRG